MGRGSGKGGWGTREGTGIHLLVDMALRYAQAVSVAALVLGSSCRDTSHGGHMLIMEDSKFVAESFAMKAERSEHRPHSPRVTCVSPIPISSSSSRQRCVNAPHCC